jgi:murein DD-endopeptidase MepM/ murein hydrolase activator NlpD
MVRLLLEALHPERHCLRIRIKPSWSARVYGTYGLSARVVPLALLLAASTVGLLGRLVVVNLALPSPSAEVHALRQAVARGLDDRDTRLPERVASLEREAEAAHVAAGRLDIMAGIGDGEAGLGRMEDGDAAEPAGPGREVPLERVVSEVARLGGRYDRLQRLLVEREEDWRYLPSIAPVESSDFVPTSSFGPRLSPFTGRPELHRGQDLAADPGTPVLATADGTVLKVEPDGSRSAMGRHLVIDHDGRFETWYGHCERLLVEVGEVVHRHQVVAEVGNTGRSTGPHVHYEVRVAGEARDPRQYMVFEPHFNGEAELLIE